MINNNIKFSIIVAVYNIEKYIEKNIKSIINQTYKNYEVIIINDGSTDKTKKKIEEMIRTIKNFKLISQKNLGLSEARNRGVNEAIGDYLIFIDGDDYIEKDLLLKLKEEIDKYPKLDLIKYHFQMVDEKNNIISTIGYKAFSNKTSHEAYQILLEYQPMETSWSYAYKTSFFKKNKFKFAKGRYHEDFGLTHHIILKAKRISSIPYYGYNYVQRPNSIMNSNSKEIIEKRIFDLLHHLDYYENVYFNDVDISKDNKELLMSNILYIILYKNKFLDKANKKIFIKELSKRKIYRYYSNKTIKDKIRRIIIKYFLSLYIKKNYR